MSNSVLSNEELAAGTKLIIGGILTNNSPDPSDQAILTNFYNYEISPGTSAAVCIVRYLLEWILDMKFCDIKKYLNCFEKE